MSGGVSGFQINQQRDRLVPVLEDIAKAHCAANGCAMNEGYIEAILCDLSDSFERQEKTCGTKKAA